MDDRVRAVGTRLAVSMPGAFAGTGVVAGDDGWRRLGDALDPVAFAAGLETACRRWRTDDAVVAVSLLVRELTVAAATVAITPFARDRRLLDVSPDSLLVRQDERVATIGLGPGPLAVLPGDELVGADGVRVLTDDDAMFEVLIAGLLDGVVPRIIDAARAGVRVGSRHLWGNVALAIANTLTTISGEVGSRADRDRSRLLAARPELEPTIELLEVLDGAGRELTFAIRRTCCLVDRVPGGMRCATCSLEDRSRAIAIVGRHYLAERPGRS
jgi:hypothetical protein